MNLVLAGSEAAHGFGAEIPDTGRMVFVTPWRGCSIVGTSHVGYSGDPDQCHCSSEDAAALMDDLRAALPGLDFATHRILWRQGGLLPAAGAGHDRSAVPAARAELVDHARSDGRDGLISVIGEKYTTARSLAQRAVALSLHKLRQRPRPCAVLQTPLPGAGDGMAARDLEEPASGAQARDRWRVAVREEMAVTLEDLVFRRCDRAVRGHMAPDELEAAADVMADELRWSSQRRLDEVASVRRVAARHGGIWASTQWPESTPERMSADIRRAV